MTEQYQRLYPSFRFERPGSGILRITFDAPGLNSVSPDAHREIADVWTTIDRDPRRVSSCCRAPARASRPAAASSCSMVSPPTSTSAARVVREARDLVRNIIDCSKPIVSAIHGPAVGAGLVAALLADVSIVARTARIIDGHTRLGVAAGDHAAVCWPLLCGMAKAKYYLLDVRHADRRGGRAHRTRVAVRRRRPGARPRHARSPSNWPPWRSRRCSSPSRR